jgi:ABC-type polar amino acid transport system ATPase subunit
VKFCTPKLGAVDQITSALDPELVAEVLASSREFAADGTTLLMATQCDAFRQPRRLYT